MKTVELVRDSFNPTLSIEGIVLTMVDLRNTLNKQVVDEVKKHFGPKVYSTMIPRTVTLAEAPSHGKPVMLYDVRSSGAQSYLALAREVLGGPNG
jgi:chromosome partitioning protein